MVLGLFNTTKLPSQFNEKIINGIIYTLFKYILKFFPALWAATAISSNQNGNDNKSMCLLISWNVLTLLKKRKHNLVFGKSLDDIDTPTSKKQKVESKKPNMSLTNKQKLIFCMSLIAT